MYSTKRYSKLSWVIVFAMDIVMLMGTLWFAYVICAYRFRGLTGNVAELPALMGGGLADFLEHDWLLLVILPLYEFALMWAGVFRPSRQARLIDTAWTVVASVFVAAGILGAFSFALRLAFFTRGLATAFILLSALALTVEKCAFVMLVGAARRRNRDLLFVLVVGTGQRAQSYVRDISQHPEWGMRVVGYLDKDAEMTGTLIDETKVIGQLGDLPRLLVEEVVDLVVFLVPRNWLGEIAESIRHCQIQGVNVQVAVDLFDHKIGRVRFATKGRFPLLIMESTSLDAWQRVMKRALDIFVSGSALLLLSPLFLFVAAAIKLASRGPVFYVQARSGLRGREFKMLKFRSMLPNADALLENLREDNEMSGAAFKMANDPRVTPIGKFLRRFSLDEIPQLLNVLRGDMSIVGPRPLIATENNKYEEWQRRRMSVRPGLTCLWQINGRSHVDFEHWMELDLKYIDNWSILADLRIMAKTVPAVFRGRGAY